MIDKVVIFGIRRGNQLISQNELMQSIGRCGRSYTKSGQAIVLTNSDDYENAQRLMFGKMSPIQSVMDEIQNVSFHVLPMILTQVVKNEQTFDKWYQKTLAFIQGKRVYYKDVLQYLQQQQAIAYFNGNVIINQLGEISSKYYFPPNRIKQLKDRLIDVVQSDDIQNPHAVSWMLSNDRLLLGTVDEQELSEYKSKVSNYGYMFEHGELLHGYTYYCLINSHRPKWLKYAISNEYNDIQRLLNALKKISRVVKYNIDRQIQILLLSAKKRLTIDIAKTMFELKLKTKKSTLQLIQFGVTNEQQLQLKIENIRKYGTKELNQQINNRGK